jgi:4-carboxymuconolactone decarboxylase
MSSEQKDLYDSILSGPRGNAARSVPMTDAVGRFHGPFNAMLFDPPVGDGAQRLGAAIRYRSALEGRTRELAILEIARLYRSDFEWLAHEHVGRSVGLTDDEVASLKSGTDAPTLSPHEAMARSVVRRLVTNRDLDDDQYREAVELLGEVIVADLVVLVGFYEYTALALRVFRVPLPEGAPSAFS